MDTKSGASAGIFRALSKAMLVVGGLMILSGLGWGLWVRLNAPPPPVITDQGAVVLAVTAPATASATAPTVELATVPSTALQTPVPQDTATPAPTPRPTQPVLPGWTVTPIPAASTPTVSPPTALPLKPTPSPTVVRSAEEPPTRIVAPAIELDAKVVPMNWEAVDRNGTMVSEWVVPKNAAGWHVNSALPGTGENVVLSGHHNIEGKVFRYVVDLEPGDEIVLYVGDSPYYYTVAEKYILKEAGMPLEVRRNNARWILPTGEERLTLVTCWPYEWPGNTHRVIVVARPEELTDLIPGAR